MLLIMSSPEEWSFIPDALIRDEIESYATGWIGSLEMGVQRIESSQIDDKPRAIRGHVVGSIVGDAINGLSGAVVDLRQALEKHFISPAFTRRIRVGTGKTWFASTGAIVGLGNKLPEPCVAGFNSIFSEYRPFVENLLGGVDPISDLKTVYYDTRRLLLKIENFPTSGLYGVDFQDLRYAFELFKPGGLLHG